MKTNKKTNRKKRNLSRKLIKLLIKVREFIRKHPHRFNQGHDSELTRASCPINSCNTPQCILGWMRLIYRGKKPVEELFPDSDFVDRLYFASEWPKKFQVQGEYSEYSWKGVTAKTAAKRITHYIKTDGLE